MKLPNPERAVVAIEKLRDYSLSLNHSRGRNKARVFAAALSITAEDAQDLQQAILSAAITEEALPTDHDDYGQRYQVDFLMKWQGKQAVVRSLWIVRRGENYPRLTSCYVL